MAGVVRLDTQVVIWLYSGEVGKLSQAAQLAIESSRLVISPMVQLELTYLHEIGRLSVGGAEIVADLSNRVGLILSDQPMAAVVSAAASLAWTRDPFDRLIAADALAANCPLLTKDDSIRAHVSIATW